MLAFLTIGLLADPATDPTSTVPPGSPTAAIIAVTLGGIAAIITAAAGFASMRRRRLAEADAMPLQPLVDREDQPARLRERLAKVETRLDIHDREIGDLQDQMRLHRAVDVATEADASPRRRRDSRT